MTGRIKAEADMSHGTQVEDPGVVYLLSSWTSAETHDASLPSPENPGFLESPKGLMAVEFLFHADVDKLALSPNAYCIPFARRFIDSGKKEAFAKVWGENKHHLEDFTKPYLLVGGWRIDGVEEGRGGGWVQFWGFQSVEHYLEFVETEEF